MQGLTNKRVSYCASYFLYVVYLTKVEGLVFKSAVLNLYYQKCKIILTFSLKLMTSRKIAIDNSVQYFLRSEQTNERDIKPSTLGKCKQDKKISQNNKKMIKVALSGERFELPKSITNCYF